MHYVKDYLKEILFKKIGKINAVKLINFKSELAINSHGSAFKVVRTKYCYLVNKTVGMIKCTVEFILARNNYFYFHLLLSNIVSTAEKLITTVYTYFVPVISFFKIFHNSESPENIFPSTNTLCGYISVFLSQFMNYNFTNTM